MAVARKGELRAFIDEQGKTRLPHTHRITAPQAGRILAIQLTEGDRVTKDQVVAQMDPSDLQTLVVETEALVQTLDAKIRINDFNAIENSAREEIDNVIEAMDRFVEAADLTAKQSEAVQADAKRKFERRQKILDETGGGGVAQEELEAAATSEATAALQHAKSVLNERAIQALHAAFQIGPRYVMQWLERKKLNREVLMSQKEQARAAFEQAKRNEKRGTMRSPVDGIVLKREVSNERVLAAGQLVMEIGSLSEPEVEADILSQDVLAVREGNPVDVYTLTQNRLPIRATVKRIYPGGFTKVSSLGVEQQRVKVVIQFERVDADPRTSQQLGTDYRVRVRIYTASKDDAVAIPRNAIFQGETGQWQAFVVRRGKAVRTTLEVGIMNDEEVEILSGVSADERVVLAPDMSLNGGQRVSARVLHESQ